jgi:hypothetical protein
VEPRAVEPRPVESAPPVEHHLRRHLPPRHQAGGTSTVRALDLVYVPLLVRPKLVYVLELIYTL